MDSPGRTEEGSGKGRGVWSAFRHLGEGLGSGIGSGEGGGGERGVGGAVPPAEDRWAGEHLV